MKQLKKYQFKILVKALLLGNGTDEYSFTCEAAANNKDNALLQCIEIFNDFDNVKFMYRKNIEHLNEKLNVSSNPNKWDKLISCEIISILSSKLIKHS